jgi:hypothetical protein
MSTLNDCLAFLESLGADAELREAVSSDLAACLAEADIPAPLREALIAGHPEALMRGLSVRSPVCCLIAPGTPDEEEEGDEEEPDHEEEEPEDEDAPANGFASSSVCRTR